MANETVIKAVENLSVRRGGNIFTKKQLINQHKDNICVFIGLGGLGGRTVNEIKSLTEKEMTDNDRRFFLAIDTCLGDMDKISRINMADLENADADKNKKGTLNPDEKVQLYDAANPFAIADADENMKQWLNVNAFQEVRLDGEGAQATRQLGRVMLFANDNYNRVKSEIAKKIKEANDKRRTVGASKVAIYIIAGVSGGTGSGTVVDISYMIRNIIAGIGTSYFFVEGCIFTPDVQLNDEGIAGHEEILLSLKTNFYAAIKEIDYFYNNKERNKLYKCPQPGEPERSENIFDECRLISRKDHTGAAVCEDSSEVIKKFAQAVMYEIAPVADTEEVMSYPSYRSNIPRNINTWLATGAAEGMNLPDWAPFRYSAFGYGSFYIPKDELFAYCAHKLIERLCEQWNNQNISEEALAKEIRKVGLTDGRTFASKLFDIAGCKDAFVVDQNLIPIDPIGPGPVWHVDKYISELDSYIISTTASVHINKYLKAAEGTDASKLKMEFTNEIIQMVDNAFYAEDKGPAYAINLLSAAIDRPDWFEFYNEGILRKLDRIIGSVSTEAANWLKELDILHEQLMMDAEELKKFELGKHDEGKLQNFIEGYANYAKDMLKAHLLRNSEDYLIKIRDILNAKNHQLFEIYTTTLNHICKVLKDDSEYVTDTERKKEGSVTTFTFDITNFAKDDPVSNRIIQFFDGVVDNKELSAESKNFVDQIFGVLKQKLDTENVPLTSEMVEDVLHEYFSSSFKEWVASAIEKFCYIAYSDANVTPEDVTAIFSDDERKTAALMRVAQDIRLKLTGKAKVMLTSADTTRSIERFASYNVMGMIKETAAINNHFDSNRTTLPEGWSEFIMYKKIHGFPLFLMDGLKECKAVYDKHNVAGLHLDEVGDNWRYLPEPFGYPAARCVGLYKDDGNDITEADRLVLKDIFEKATVALKYGLLTKCSVDKVDAQGTAVGQNVFYALSYKFVNEQEESSQEIYNKMKPVYDEIEEKDDFVKVLTAAGYRIAIPVDINWLAINPHYDVMQNRTEFGDDQDFGNFIKLIYSNVEWRDYLEKAVSVFKKYYDVYEQVKKDYAVTKIYNEMRRDLYQGIRFGAVTMPDEKTFALHYGDKPEQMITLEKKNTWEELDKVFFMYHFFVEVMLSIDVETYKDYRRHIDVLRDEGVLADKAVILGHIKDVISNPDYLGEKTRSAQLQNFKGALEVAEKKYSVPYPCGSMKTDEEIGTVISNLNDFYKWLDDQLDK